MSPERFVKGESERTRHVPGCSFYEYNLGAKKIPAGRIYFDLATLLRQIGAGA